MTCNVGKSHVTYKTAVKLNFQKTVNAIHIRKLFCENKGTQNHCRILCHGNSQTRFIQMLSFKSKSYGYNRQWTMTLKTYAKQGSLRNCTCRMNWSTSINENGDE